MQLSSLGHLDVTGDITGASINADGDTSAGDNAAMGYTAAEGLILTGQGSTSDITLKNDADATVFTVPTGTDDILFPDNAKAMFGAGSDLQIYHDGSNSYIKDAGTGNLSILASQVNFVNAAGDETLMQATQNGAVTLLYDNAVKLATASGGVSITGNATFADDGTAIFGASSDLQIKHNGTNSIIDNNTGSLLIQSDALTLESDSGEDYLTAAVNGAVTLFYDNASKLATVTGGVNGTGTLTASTEVTVSSDVRFKSNIETIDSALDKVKAMRGVYFDKHGAEDKRSVGVIAQEMQEVMPEVVVTDDTEDKHLSVAYGNLVGVLIEAVKELSEEVEKLKAK